MTEVLVSADAAALCVDYLIAALAAVGDTDTAVAARVQKVDRQIVVSLLDTQITNIVIQRSVLRFDCIVDATLGRQEAQDLGQLARGLLGAMKGTIQAGTTVYNIIDASLGLSDSPDPITGTARYPFAVEISTRRVATLDDSTVVSIPDWLRPGVLTVEAGSNITVDDTDPQHPIVSSTGGGGGATFVYEQDVAAATWTIVHNLGYFPAVTVADTLGREFEGQLTYLDDNTVQIDFATAVTGVAYFS